MVRDPPLAPGTYAPFTWNTLDPAASLFWAAIPCNFRLVTEELEKWVSNIFTVSRLQPPLNVMSGSIGTHLSQFYTLLAD